MSDQWNAGAFTANTDQGPRSVAGWLKGPFALDFRVWGPGFDWDGSEGYERGWLLTHLPSGFQMFGILAPLADAQQIADEAFELCDWSFSDPAEAKGKAKLLRPLREKHGDKLAFRLAQFGPLFKVREEEPAA